MTARGEYETDPLLGLATLKLEECCKEWTGRDTVSLRWWANLSPLRFCVIIFLCDFTRLL